MKQIQIFSTTSQGGTRRRCVKGSKVFEFFWQGHPGDDNDDVSRGHHQGGNHAPQRRNTDAIARTYVLCRAPDAP